MPLPRDLWVTPLAGTVGGYLASLAGWPLPWMVGSLLAVIAVRCLANRAFIRTLGQTLQRGAIIMIDYGHSASEFYHPERHMGTLLGHYRHHTVQDLFYLPGLMDMHTHLMSQHSKDSYTERFFMDQADYALRSTVYARATLLAGFTTVRDVGSDDQSVFAVRNAITAGRMIGRISPRRPPWTSTCPRSSPRCAPSSSATSARCRRTTSR